MGAQMKHSNPAVQEVGERIANHMDVILSYFKPGAKIAVVVYREGHPDQDCYLTNGEGNKVIEAINRRLTDPKSVAAVV